MSEKMSKRISVVFLWIIALGILIPVYFVVINSFKTKAEAAMLDLALPTQWQAKDNYEQMIEEGHVVNSFINSLYLTVISVILITFCAATMAFIIERRKSMFTKMLNLIVMTGLVLPIQIIPTFFICKGFNLPNNIAYIFVMVATNLPLCTFLYVGYFKSIPRDIDESAIMDGAGPLTLFFRIIFPLAKPMTVTVIILSSMTVWNDFGVSIYFLNNVNLQTLPLTVYNFFGNHNSDWQLVFANVVCATLPVAILYLFLQKQIIAGMTAGSVKS